MIALHTAITPMNTIPAISNWTHSGMEEVLAPQNALANQRVREAKELSGQPRCYVQTDHPWDEVLNRHTRAHLRKMRVTQRRYGRDWDRARVTERGSVSFVRRRRCIDICPSAKPESV